MRLSALLSCRVLASCVTAEHYSAQAPWTEVLSIGSACTPTYKHYRRQLKEGVILEVGALRSSSTTAGDFGLGILLRIERSHSVRLKSSRIDVRVLDDATERRLEVVGISSGIPESSGYGRVHDLPEINLPPLARLEGTGRAAHIKTQQGVYSAWFGEGDVYRLTVSAFDGAPKAVEVRLPLLEVDGETMRIEPIRFARETASTLCLQ